MLILLSDRIEIKKKIITRDKEEYFIRIKRSTHQEGITIINIHAQNKTIPSYMKQKLTEVKGEIHNSTIIGGYFSTSVSITLLKETTRTTSQKIKKETKTETTL